MTHIKFCLSKYVVTQYHTVSFESSTVADLNYFKNLCKSLFRKFWPRETMSNKPSKPYIKVFVQQRELREKADLGTIHRKERVSHCTSLLGPLMSSVHWPAAHSSPSSLKVTFLPSTCSSSQSQ